MKINKILPGILLIILFLGVILTSFDFNRQGAVIILLLLPLTVVYFYGILLKNYKVNVNSKLRMTIWLLAWISMISIMFSFILDTFHLPIKALLGLTSLLTVIALSVFFLIDLLYSYKKRSLEIGSFFLLILPLIYISFRYFPRIPSGSDSQMVKILNREKKEKKKLAEVFQNSNGDTLTIKIKKTIHEIHEIETELIVGSGGLTEDGEIKGGKDKTVVEIVLIGPEGSEKGRAYTLYSSLKADFPELTGKSIPNTQIEFIDKYFKKRTVEEAIFELNHLEKMILIYGLEKRLNPSSN